MSDRQRKNRRAFIKSVGAGSLVALAGCSGDGNQSQELGGDSDGNGGEGGSTGTASGDGSLTTVKIAEEPGNGVLSIEPRIADKKGWVEEAGLRFEYSGYGIGIETLRALAGGKAHFSPSHASWAALVAAQTGDVGTVSVAKAPGPHHVMANKNSVNDISDLEGGTVATIPGSVFDWLWPQVFEQSDSVSADNVNIKEYSAASDMLAAVLAGRIDASWTWGQYWRKASGNDKLQSVATLKGSAPNAKGSWMPYSFRQSWAEENTDTAIAVMEVIEKANKFADNNPKETAEITSQVYDVPNEDALSTIEKVDYKLGLLEEHVSLWGNYYQFATERGFYDEFDWKNAILLDIAKEALPDDRVTWSR